MNNTGSEVEPGTHRPHVMSAIAVRTYQDGRVAKSLEVTQFHSQGPPWVTRLQTEGRGVHIQNSKAERRPRLHIRGERVPDDRTDSMLLIPFAILAGSFSSNLFKCCDSKNLHA